MELKFQGDNIFLRTFKSNRDSFRVEIDCGRYAYEVLKDIPTLPEGVYDVIIKPVAEEYGQ